MGFGHFRAARSSQLSATVFVLSLALGSGCEKASGPAAPGVEPPAVSSAPPPEASPAPAPESHNEPPPQDRQSDDAGSAPVSALEKALSPPSFDKSASTEFKKAFKALDSWVRGKGGKVHAALVDLETDKWLLRSAASTPVNPASNAKLVTAAAALELLGPDYKFSTELFGDVGEKGHAEVLVLRGNGAPDLTTADLWRLLRVAKGQGLSSVGKVLVDQSRFSEQFVPPAFEQQPKEWAPFRAPISALALDGNTISLNVVSTGAGEPARVWYAPAGIVSPQGRVETSTKGSGDKVSWSLDPTKDAQRPVSKVGGRLAQGLGRRRYSRRLHDPRLAPGLAFVSLMKDAGIEVKGGVELGKRDRQRRIAVWKSEPVAELVRAMGKESDNFTAEMLLVALSGVKSGAKKGAAKEEPWSSARGAEVATSWLKQKKIPLEGIVIKNGSGLFDANLLSAELLTRLLASMQDNPRVYQEFVSQLATGATDGTLKKRMRGNELAPRVRAKTGTLRKVDALSGYIQRPGGRSPAAFSIIVVGPKVSHSAVRGKVDKTILKWVELLD